MKMSDVLNKYTDFLFENGRYEVDSYGNNLLIVENLEKDKEDLIREFLFREFNNIYPNEITVGI